jgi:hypothetical protein
VSVAHPGNRKLQDGSLSTFVLGGSISSVSKMLAHSADVKQLRTPIRTRDKLAELFREAQAKYHVTHATFASELPAAA